jgi:hypothetical protein
MYYKNIVYNKVKKEKLWKPLVSFIYTGEKTDTLQQFSRMQKQEKHTEEKQYNMQTADETKNTNF